MLLFIQEIAGYILVEIFSPALSVTEFYFKRFGDSYGFLLFLVSCAYSLPFDED